MRSRHALLPALAAFLGAEACRAPRAPVPPSECEAVWADSSATNVLNGLVSTTVPGDPVWVDYGLEDGTYAVYPGESSEGRSCLAAVRAGEIIGYLAADSEPTFLTQLYGYYITWESAGGPMSYISEMGAQPAPIADWLNGLGAEAAVIIPVRIEGLPFEVPALAIYQTAIHEGFHVFVETPVWLGNEGNWPTWDVQPERSAVRACYAASDEIAASLAEERTALVQMIEGLMDDHRDAACSSGRSFLDLREARYALTGDVEVQGRDSTNIGCEAGEDLMELEEGTADYASWSVMYHRGQATREQLLRRYGAQQAEMFYLTGAMQLHAVRLMDPGALPQVTRTIAASESPEEGAVVSVFRRALDEYCR